MPFVTDSFIAFPDMLLKRGWCAMYVSRAGFVRLYMGAPEPLDPQSALSVFLEPTCWWFQRIHQILSRYIWFSAKTIFAILDLTGFQYDSDVRKRWMTEWINASMEMMLHCSGSVEPMTTDTVSFSCLQNNAILLIRRLIIRSLINPSF